VGTVSTGIVSAIRDAFEAENLVAFVLRADRLSRKR
jgi:hypothetical protein